MGDLAQAAIMFDAVDKLHEFHGFNPQLRDAPGYECSKIRLQERMDPEAYEAARLRGWNMNRAEAVTYALDGSISDS